MPLALEFEKRLSLEFVGVFRLELLSALLAGAVLDNARNDSGFGYSGRRRGIFEPALGRI
jgi:hypothetical protein